MGADLYIRDIFDRNYERYEPLFKKAVIKRDAYSGVADEKTKKRLQEEVDKYYELMYEEGYFRDSYNATNLLWKMGMSWWNSEIERLLEDGQMTPEGAEKFLKTVEEGEKTRLIPYLKSKEFEKKFGDGEETLDEWRRYFKNKAAELKAFLKLAIKEKKNIRWSV